MKYLIILFCLSGLAHANISLPAGARLILPKDLKDKAGWVIPPTEKSNPQIKEWTIDRQGSPWFLSQNNAIFSLHKKIIFKSNKQINSLLWSNNNLIASNSQDVGLMVASKEKNGLQSLNFTPYLITPLKDVKVAAAGSEGFYVYGFNPKSKKYVISLYNPFSGTGFRTIYATSEKITALAGNGVITYFSVGKNIFIFDLSTMESKVFFVHPNDPIVQIDQFNNNKIIYTTSRSVGTFANNQPLEFIQFPNVSIKMLKDNLFVMFGSNGGLMKIGDFKLEK